MIFATEAWFRGRWSLHRRIEDRIGMDAVFTGTADFRITGAAKLSYTETGELTLGSAVMTAERRYDWLFGPAGEITVNFDDGRLFHQFDPGRQQLFARHYCGDDIYDVRYEFGAKHQWRSVWRVSGPRKDYVSHTEFARMPGNLEN